MLKFNRDRFRVSVDPMSLTLSPLLEVWRDDTSEDKVDATKLLTYIHLVSQIDQLAPFAKADPTEVSKLVKKEVWADYEHKFLGKYDETKVEDIVLQYQLAFESADDASVRSYDKKIYEIKNIIESTPVTIEKSVSKGVVTFVSNYPLISKMLQEMTKISKARDDMKALIIKQTSRDDGTKGKRKLSFIDKRRRDMAEEKKEETRAEDEEPIGL